MTPEEFNQALRGEKRIYGTLLVSGSPFWPKVIGDCGLDFVFIDTEHIAFNRETFSWRCRTYTAMGLPPLVRITDPDPDKATVALDDGAAAVVAPYIETPEQVRALRGATKLRPLKGEKLQATLDGKPLEPALGNYIAANTACNSMLINIESVPAMQRLDQLLSLEGTDAVLIGPHDLSCSLGVAEQYDHPDFLAACEKIITTARARGIGAGIHFWGSIDEHARFLDMGANILIHKADIIFFKNGIRTELAAIRESLGLKTGDGPGGDVNI